MKHRFIRRAGLRRLTARLPTAAGKSLELLVTAAPLIIEVLERLQRRYRNQPEISQPNPDSIVMNYESPGAEVTKPAGTLPRHPPARAADPPGDPASQALPDK